MPAISRPHTAYCVLHYWTAPTHSHGTHLLLEELISHSPFEMGVWGCKGTHTYTLCRGLSDYTRRKATKKMPIESSELQQRKTLEINHKNNPYYTTPLDTEFPNLHTNCTLRVLGPYKESGHAVSKAKLQ